MYSDINDDIFNLISLLYLVTYHANLKYWDKVLSLSCTNSIDPAQTAPEEQSDLGLHCLPMILCRKFLTHPREKPRKTKFSENFRIVTVTKYLVHLMYILFKGVFILELFWAVVIRKESSRVK